MVQRCALHESKVLNSSVKTPYHTPYKYVQSRWYRFSTQDEFQISEFKHRDLDYRVCKLVHELGACRRLRVSINSRQRHVLWDDSESLTRSGVVIDRSPPVKSHSLVLLQLVCGPRFQLSPYPCRSIISYNTSLIWRWPPAVVTSHHCRSFPEPRLQHKPQQRASMVQFNRKWKQA